MAAQPEEIGREIARRIIERNPSLVLLDHVEAVLMVNDCKINGSNSRRRTAEVAIRAVLGWQEVWGAWGSTSPPPGSGGEGPSRLSSDTPPESPSP
jgi:hypothetical protein